MSADCKLLQDVYCHYQKWPPNSPKCFVCYWIASQGALISDRIWTWNGAYFTLHAAAVTSSQSKISNHTGSICIAKLPHWFPFSNRYLDGLNLKLSSNTFFVQKMASLVEAPNILLSGIWSRWIVWALRVNLQWCGSIAVTWGMILTIFSSYRVGEKCFTRYYLLIMMTTCHWV